MSDVQYSREAECPLFGCAGRHKGVSGSPSRLQDTQVPDWKSFTSQYIPGHCDNSTVIV